MSYILDALKKADAQRERGSVPGLHSQPVLLAPKAQSRGGRAAPLRWLPWAASAVGVLALGTWAWRSMVHEPPPQQRADAALASVVGATPAAAVAPSSAPAPVFVAPAAPPVRASAAAATVAAVTAPKPAAPARPAPPTVPPVAAARLDRTAEPPPAPEMPEALRRELPALVVGGSIYSSDPSSRVLIVNGQAYHEHDTVAPGVSLEQIKLKAAVLSYKGYRHHIDF